MAEPKEYVLIFDLPAGKKSMLVKINRTLHKMEAQKLQHSVWQSDRLEELGDIASMIKRAGGRANVLEKKVVV